MKEKEFDVKSVGNDQFGMKIVTTLLELRSLIAMAAEAWEANGKAIEQLHLLRTDMEHMMADTFDSDPVKDALIQQRIAGQYRDVQRRRRELATENAALEHVFNSDLYSMTDEVLEAMTGQMQFIDHAYYKPKSRLSGLLGG